MASELQQDMACPILRSSDQDLPDTTRQSGWARRGPSGTIGTNRPDGYATIDRIAADLAAAGSPARSGRSGFDALAQTRGLDVISFDEWKHIEAAETGRARTDAPREKFLVIGDMIAARR